MIKYQHLCGKPFVHGSSDCYTAVRNFYRDNYGIELTDYARPDDWWYKDMNLYMDLFPKEGFQLIYDEVHDYRPGDVSLLAIRSKVANHAVVHVGESKVFHHMYGKLSCAELFRGPLRSREVAHIRHSDVNVQIQETEMIDVQSLIPEAVRRRFDVK